MTPATIPTRSEIKAQDTWDLSGLYKDLSGWEKDITTLQEKTKELSAYQGRLGESIEIFHEALVWNENLGQLMERLGHYSGLRATEDLSDQKILELQGRFEALAVEVGAGLSWWDPELMSIPEPIMNEWLKSPLLSSYRVMLEKVLRFRPHTLTPGEERLLSLGAQARGAVGDTFNALTNVDLKFESVKTPEGELPLTQSTFSLFLQNPDREIRLEAFKKFYNEFSDHAHTLSNLYAGSIHQDIFLARASHFHSSLDRSLFPDKVPVEVYDTLITTVRESLPILHHYYGLRKKALGVERLHHADMYAPLVANANLSHSWDEAVGRILTSLEPLGVEYTSTLRAGLLGRWCDRYENKGKRSGAFSSGGWFGEPYILMNYHDENLRDVFTLAHEAGHSMHSWYSVKSNPYSSYNYTIFEAEVASTFNEQLLARHLLSSATDARLRSSILGKQIEDFVATFFRQTMFAEFERAVHLHAESGGGLTLDFFRTTYRSLLQDYFGPEVEFSEQSDLEGLRIPHFYRAFYVYKYATGLAASIALSRKVLEGGEKEREDYLNFLKSGGSRYPIDSLKAGGVDMSTKEPLLLAIDQFKKNLDEFELANP